MKIRKHILLLSVFLIGMLGSVKGQYLSVVCPGDTGVAYNVRGTEGSTFDWRVEGGEIVRDYGDSIIVNWGEVPGEYEVFVQEISEYGCLSEPRTGMVLVSAPDLNMGDDTYICEGDVFQISPQGVFYSYEWHDGSTDPVYSTTEEGLISLTVTDQYGCPWSDDIYLEVKPLPEVYLGRDTSLCGDQVLYLNGGDDAVKYNWSTGETSHQIAVFQSYKQISVQVEDEFGCVNTDTIVIENCDVSLYFADVPNMITPGSDGRNDTWRIEKLESFPDAVVDIYDRWGRLIWRSAPGYPEAWDGTNMKGKEVDMDSYHYVIMLNFGGDDARVHGSISVIK